MRLSIRNIPLRAAVLYGLVIVSILAVYAALTFVSVTGNLEAGLNQANEALLRQMNQKIDLTLREIDKMALDLVQGLDIALSLKI